MIAATFPLPPSGDEGDAALPVLPVVDTTGGQAWPLAGATGAEGVPGAAPLGGTWEGILPPGNVGQMLKALGQLAVGRTVERFWAEEGAQGFGGEGSSGASRHLSRRMHVSCTAIRGVGARVFHTAPAALLSPYARVCMLLHGANPPTPPTPPRAAWTLAHPHALLSHLARSPLQAAGGGHSSQTTMLRRVSTS